ncbi:SRPBCC family protein [Muriicola soli]|uniref:SRPBCC family protein n=1 Tax=Muriicola soli TaxID=2507538 RepID=A0A411E8M0_9FLAO|nr:SRPBCC family protein [Muriicola soli]QBA64029.1 SRPBCC family protein [Muriicola soli]
MKYTCSVIIDLPANQLADLWANPDFFDQWQDGFKSVILLEGESGSIGAKSKLVYGHEKKDLELIETIILNNLPEKKIALYEHVQMINTQTTCFEKLTDNSTRFISEVEYTHFRGFIPKLMAMVFPGVFKKQSQKWMDQFKIFAEKKYNSS